MGTYDPTTQSVDIPSILTSIATQNRSLEDSKAQIAANSTAAQEILSGSVDALNQAAQAKQQVVIADETAKAEAKQKAIDVLSRIGVNDDLMASLGIQSQKEFDAAMASQDVITAKNSVGFLDNPIEWLFNQFTIGQDIDEYNAHAIKHNALEARQTELNNLRDQTVQAQMNLEAPRTAETIKNLAIEQSTIYREKATQQQLESLRWNTSAIEDASKMTQEQLSNQVSGANLVKMDQQMQIQRDEAEIRRKELENSNKRLELETQNAQLTLDEKKKKQEQITLAVQDYNAGRAIANLPPVQNEAQAIKELTAQGRTGAIARAYQDAGAQALQSGNKTRVLGSSFGDSVDMIVSTSARGNAAAKPVYDMIYDVYGQQQQANPTAKPDLLATNTAQIIQNKIDAQRKSIDYADKSNLFVAPDVSVMQRYAPEALKGNKVVDIISKQIASVGGSQDPYNVLKVVAANIGKDYSITQASKDIAAYYDTVNHYQFATKDLSALGMKVSPGYNIRVPTADVAVSMVYSGAALVTDVTDIPTLSRTMDVSNKAVVSSAIMSILHKAKNPLGNN